MKKKIYPYLIIITVFNLIGCGTEDVDVTPPTMVVNSYTPQPVEDEICGSLEPTVFNLTGGDQLSFNVEFNDNDALSQFKVDIHNNFDCHGHGGGSAPSIPPPAVNNLTTDWSVLEIENLFGISQSVERVFTVPENVTAGNYHYHIQVIDESGNDNPAANFFALKILNPLDGIEPVIEVEEPAVRNFSAKKGETIRFKGRVTDDRSLSDGGNGVLFLSYTDLSSGNTFSTDQAFVFDENVDDTFEFDFEYTIPQTLVDGRYNFSLGANDGVRNVAEFEFFEVEISN